MRLRVHAALLAVAALFSINYIISKLGMRAFSPMTFAYLRVVGAALILSLIPRPPIPPDARRKITLYSILGVVANQALFLGGLALTSAHVAAILITSVPVFTLAAAIALGRERATPWKVGGIALAAVGALLIVGVEGFSGSTRSLLGALMIVCNCFSYSLFLVLSKPLFSQLSPRAVIARMFATATVLMLPIAAWPMWTEHWSAIPTRAWVALLVVIAGPTVAAYLLNGWALRHADSSLVAAYTYVQPVLTVVLAAVFLHEEIHASALIAAGLIAAGVAMAGRGR